MGSQFTLCSRSNCVVVWMTFTWQSAHYALSFDGLMNILEMRKTRCYDSGTVQVIGKNVLGEVASTTTLTVMPLGDLRSALRPTSVCK